MNIGEQNLFIGRQWMPSEGGETYESGKTATRAASGFFSKRLGLAPYRNGRRAWSISCNGFFRNRRSSKLEAY
jgi:hypothetical protein